MKLNEKGCGKVIDWYAEQDQVVTWKSAPKIDFDYDDFEDYHGEVVLSVDDAEEIVQYLWDTVGMISVSKKRGKAIDNFIKKVWQVKAKVTKGVKNEAE